MSFRLSFCLLAAALALPGQPLPALVEEALRHNHEILAAQKKYEAARQMPAQASALADPTVSVGYTANGAPYPVAGIGRDVTSNANPSSPACLRDWGLTWPVPSSATSALPEPDCHHRISPGSSRASRAARLR